MNLTPNISKHTFKEQILLPILIFLLSALYLYQSYDYELNLTDEGYLLASVTRIFNGETPYKDCWLNYSPGRYYFFSFLFSLFGKDLLVIRKAWLIINSVSCLLIFLVSSRVIRSKIFSLLPVLMLLATPFPIHKSFYILTQLLNVYLIFLYLEEKISPTFFGISVGIIAFFRQDTGATGVLLFFSYLIISKVLYRKDICFDNRAMLTFTSVIHFFKGISFIIISWFGYFLYNGALSDMISQLLLGGFQANKAKALPFPSISAIINSIFEHGFSIFLSEEIYFYFPIIIFIITGLSIIRRKINKEADLNDIYILIILINGIFTYHLAITRSDYSHLTQVLCSFFILVSYYFYKNISWIYQQSIRNLKPHKTVYHFIKILLFLSMPLIFIIFNLFIFKNSKSLYFNYSLKKSYERLSIKNAHVYVDKYLKNDIEQIVSYISNNSKKGECLLVIPYGPMFNFLLDMKNPTKYDVFLPGEMDGTVEQQNTLIKSIKESTLKYIIYKDYALDGIEARRFKNYAPILFNYINNNFILEKEIGIYLILSKKGSAV